MSRLIALGLMLPCSLTLTAAAAARQDDEDPRRNGPWREVPARASRAFHEPDQRWFDLGVEREQAVLVGEGEQTWLLGLEWRRERGDAVLAWPLPDPQGQGAAPGAPPGSAPEAGQPFETVREAGGQVFHLAAAASRDALLAAWVELVDGRAMIGLSQRRGQAWSPPRRLETGPGQVVRVEVVGGESPALVWQQEFRGEGPARYRLFGAAWPGDAALGEVSTLVQARLHVRDPAVAADPRGGFWLAWVESTAVDEEVRLRHVAVEPQAGLVPGPVVEVSADELADDLHPCLSVGPGPGVWVAWDRVVDPSRSRSSRGPVDDLEGRFDKHVSIQLARFDGTAWWRPSGALQDGDVSGGENLGWGGGHPRILLHPSGSLSLAFRYLDDEGDASSFAYSYPLLVRHWDGQAFGPTRLLRSSEGGQRRAASVRSPAGMVLAWQFDRRTRRQPGVPFPLAPDGDQGGISDFGPSSLAMVRLPAPPLHPDGPGFTPRPAPLGLRRPYPTDDPGADPRWTGEEPVFAEIDGQQYRYLFGNLHRHSCLSACSGGMEPRADDRFALEQDLIGSDFFALTDHAAASAAYQVCRLHEQLEVFRTRDFVTLQGYEWSHLTGHHNVIFRGLSHAVVPPRIQLTPSARHLWDQLPPGEHLTIPHHSAELKMPMLWNVVDPAHLRLIEIYQSRRGSYEADGALGQARNATVPSGFVREALRSGVKAGIIASTDHGAGASFAVVLAEEFTREGVFDALYARRCYASTTKGLYLDFRVAGRPMGEETEAEGPIPLSLSVDAPVALSQVTVFRDGVAWKELGPRAQPARPEILLRIQAQDTRRPLGQPFRLFVEHPDAEFEAPRRAGGRGPKWQVEGQRAAFQYPAGFRTPFPFGTTTLEMHADPDASMKIEVGGQVLERSLRSLVESPLGMATGGAVNFQLVAAMPEEQFLARGEHMDTREFRGQWVDDAEPGEHWYMVRVVLVNREMAWSSPIWVSRT